MPKKYKVLSGSDVVKIFEVFGFKKVSQKGSHVKVSRITATSEKQIFVIPLHKELSAGTVRAIYSQASHYILEADLRPYFVVD
jgi:predicted RNA binding protein YcfA (HicA-like mRNA interferase family)